MSNSWKGRSVLVTGGTGFVGSFLVEYLLDHGAKVRVPIRAEHYRALSARRSEVEWMDGDLRDPDYCAALLLGMDEVFHFASSRRTSEYHEKRPSDVLNDNIRMTLALLDGLKENDLKIPVTFCSSANVPPTLDVIALAEAESVDGYILAKAICESLWLTASRQRKFPLLILRPVGVYGPRDTFNDDGNIIPALMVHSREADDGKLVLWGDGTQERAFLYVKDFIDAVFRLREADVDGVQYVTSSDVVTALTLATHIRDLVRPELEVVTDTAHTVAERRVPIRPVHPVLSDMQWTPLLEGLRATYHSWNDL